MTGRTHLLLGVSSVWILKLIPGAADSQNMGLLAGAAALGALLPDLDAPQSTIKYLRLGTRLQPFLLPATLLHRTLGHRGLMHSLLGLALIGVFAALPLGLWLGAPPAAALLLGYASHLIGDGCTKSGIALLFPNPMRWHLLPPPFRLTTGSQAEDMVFVLLAGAALLLLISNLLAPL